MEWEVLRGLAEEERRALMATTVRRRYALGTTLVHEGDLGDTFHFVAKGRVAVRVTTPTGDTATLNVLRPGQCFGEQALIAEGSRRSASIVALSVVETLQLHRDRFLELRTRFPAVTDVLVEILAGQVRNLSRQLLEAHYVPVDQRVARRLSDLVTTFDDGEPGPVSITLTQDDLASLVGATRPTTNRALKALADEGTVTVARGRIVVHDPPALERRAYGRR